MIFWIIQSIELIWHDSFGKKVHVILYEKKHFLNTKFYCANLNHLFLIKTSFCQKEKYMFQVQSIHLNTLRKILKCILYLSWNVKKSLTHYRWYVLWNLCFNTRKAVRDLRVTEYVFSVVFLDWSFIFVTEISLLL